MTPRAKLLLIFLAGMVSMWIVLHATAPRPVPVLVPVPVPVPQCIPTTGLPYVDKAHSF